MSEGEKAERLAKAGRNGRQRNGVCRRRRREKCERPEVSLMS